MIEQTNIDNITARLAAVGYTYNAENDGVILGLLWDEIEREYQHACNVSNIIPCDIPDIERVAAFRLLSMKLKTGGLAGVAVDAIVKKVTEGDTTVEYAAGSKSSSDYLAEYFAGQSGLDKSLIVRHRKLVW